MQYITTNETIVMYKYIIFIIKTNNNNNNNL